MVSSPDFLDWQAQNAVTHFGSAEAAVGQPFVLYGNPLEIVGREAVADGPHLGRGTRKGAAGVRFLFGYDARATPCHGLLVGLRRGLVLTDSS